VDDVDNYEREEVEEAEDESDSDDFLPNDMKIFELMKLSTSLTNAVCPRCFGIATVCASW
jgi:hypothetical protein